jgi:hypothetical protein
MGAVREPLGCLILVFDREATPGTEQASYRNHYLARRLVTTEGWSGHEVPRNMLAKFFGSFASASGLNDAAEAMFFLGRFFRARKSLKDEDKLSPEKHLLKIVEAEGYRFPEKFLRSRGFGELMEGYKFAVLRQDGSAVRVVAPAAK